jgi:hypothetical protein
MPLRQWVLTMPIPLRFLCAADPRATSEILKVVYQCLADHLRPQGRLGPMIDGKDVQLVPVHALESAGVNEIPAAMAKLMAAELGLTVNGSIVQLNTVGHTGASGYQRLANQACFAGEVEPGRRYFIVDDFVGQGGTLANLIGFIASQGGRVLGATVLTGKPYSAKLAPDESSIQALRLKHGPEFAQWWQETFGFGFDCLTRSEARYLDNSPDAQTIRDRIAAAGFAGSAGAPD